MRRSPTKSTPFPESRSNKGRAPGYLAALGVAVLWTGFNIVSRMGGRGQFSGFDLAALRFGVSGLLLLPVFLQYELAGQLPKLIVVALVGGIGYALTAYTGFMHAPAADAGVLVNGAIPFFATIFGWRWLGMRPGRHQVLALICSACGMAMLAFVALQANASHTFRTRWLGDLSFLAAAACFAGFGVLMRRWHIRPLQAVSSVAVISAGVFLPLYFCFTTLWARSVSIDSILLQGIYQGLMAAVCASLLFAFAVARIGPVKASMALSLVPVMTALVSLSLLGESTETTAWFGIVLVTAGALLGLRAPQTGPR